MSAPAITPDKADIQRLIVFGSVLECTRNFVLEVMRRDRARRFIAALANSGLITNSMPTNEEIDARLEKGGLGPASIGFTFRGLEALGLPARYCNVFKEKATAFAEGAHLRAARRLADTGPSSQQWWEEHFLQKRAHVLLALHANDDSQLNALTDALKKLDGATDGLAGWDDKSLAGCHLSRNREDRTVHFGLKDGISNPTIDRIHPEKKDSTGNPVPMYQPGEFLLGYPNDHKFNPWLLVNPWQSPNPWLRPLADVDPGFFRNGSFGVLRKIALDERAFDAFLKRCSVKLGETTDYVKAKLVGRDKAGKVLKPKDAEQKPDRNEFDFSDDREGFGCPFGSHIRRMNPRADQVVPFRRRPLIRRGMPYGPAYVETESLDTKRGLLGLFFCASLEDQFEHLLAEWGDSKPMGPRNRGRAKDPVIANHDDPAAMYDIPLPPSEEKTYRLGGFTTFAITRGTLYAFFPGLAGLRMLPDLREPAP